MPSFDIGYEHEQNSVGSSHGGLRFMGNMHCISDQRYPFRLDWNSRRISGRLHRDTIELSNRREGTYALWGRHIQIRITDQIPPRLHLGRLAPRRFRGSKRLRLYGATGAVKSRVSRISLATLLEDFSCGWTRVADAPNHALKDKIMGFDVHIPPNSDDAVLRKMWRLVQLSLATQACRANSHFRVRPLSDVREHEPDRRQLRPARNQAHYCSRNRLTSCCGGAPNSRLYSRLNCEALS